MVRAIAASDSTPMAASPSPSRTMRENASMTRNPSPAGRGDQQAAIIGAEIERRDGAPRCGAKWRCGLTALSASIPAASARAEVSRASFAATEAAAPPPTAPALSSGFCTAGDPSH